MITNYNSETLGWIWWCETYNM